ncbi:hypothetical protein [Mycobacterium sp. E3339]|uniref:hypothetical protein n=1 Tax=Mycobacterium sp. E3339 TaxID=1834146 RepID=UPI0007FD7694|nr:hypothetical protein [Mycobacterium sp. E3339]OBG63124.1 hypothetical protein A5702_23340 [Mycobacterium sp. E3339]
MALDVQNVRLAIEGLDEAGIASYLAEAEDLIGLARDLLRDGYIDNEIPIVVLEGGSYVVLEANRRVAALKAIQNPEIVGRFAAQLKRYLSRYSDADTPTEIRVMVAPSREAAQPVLARLHTGQPKRSWIREQQAIFYHAQLSDTVTVDDLRTLYSREAGKIVSFIRMGEMRQLIRSLRYDDPELEEFVKSSKLKMTSLEYAYERPRIRDVLGIEFNDRGQLMSRRLNDAQRRGVMYLLGRFKAGTLNTRSAELKQSSPQHELFVQELQRVVSGARPDEESEPADTDSADDEPGSGGSDGGSGTDATGAGPSIGGGTPASGGGAAGSGSQQPGSSGSAGTSSGSRAPNRGDTRSRLDFTEFEYQGGSAGLRRRLEELSRLDVRDFPNAAHDLMRTVLECGIKVYYLGQGANLEGKMLKQCVDDLARDFASDPSMTAWINAIKRRGSMTASQYAGTSFSLNANNHEPEAFVNARDVHEAWERIKPILKRILGC